MLKEYEKAIEDYNKAIELDPKFAIAYTNRGVAYDKLKEHEKAIEDFNKAIELDPKNVAMYLNLSEAIIIMGDYKSASKNIAKALYLSPEIKDKAMLLYLGCITKKLLGMDTSVYEKEFTEILKKDFTITWDEDFESWLKDADIDVGTKTFIKKKTELLKKHKK
jgi:tetratricopeptide (TPR) repeat protein